MNRRSKPPTRIGRDWAHLGMPPERRRLLVWSSAFTRSGGRKKSRTAALFNLDSSHPLSHTNGMTTQYEASLRNRDVLTQTSPFPNDPLTVRTFPVLGISMSSLGARLLPSIPASCLEYLHAEAGVLTGIYTAIYTPLHADLHAFTHPFTQIYTLFTHSVFHATVSGSMICVKKPVPERPPLPLPPIDTLNPSTDCQKLTGSDVSVGPACAVERGYQSVARWHSRPVAERAPARPGRRPDR